MPDEQKTRPSLAQPGQMPVAPKPMDILRNQLASMDGEFKAALPSHISLELFKRVATTAINKNPDLIGADRRSLMGACMLAAQDGLLPDGREGAFVIFSKKEKNKDTGQEVWIKAVQWMPMVYGLLKKMRNSQQLASITAHEVYDRDEFDYRLGDDESIQHKPYLGPEDPGKIIAVYAIAKLRDGTIQREVMPRWMIEKIRGVSRSKDGPTWTTWYGEMARKTVVRRLSKYLPMTTEITDALERQELREIHEETEMLEIAAEHLGSDGIERYDAVTGEVQAVAQIEHKPEPEMVVDEKSVIVESKETVRRKSAKAASQEEPTIFGGDE